MDRDENGYSKTVERLLEPKQEHSAAGWVLALVLLVMVLKMLAGCGAVMAPADQSVLDKVNAGLRVAQCVETAMRDVTQAETKRLLSQPPPVPLTSEPPTPHD